MQINIRKHNKLNGCINRYFAVRMGVDLKHWYIVSKPALKYSSETWVLRAWDKSRLKSVQMAFLRFLMGITRRDRQQNVDIWVEVGELCVLEEIHVYQKQWKDHVLETHSSRLPWQVLFYKSTETMGLGWQSTSWNYQLSPQQVWSKHISSQM